MLWGRRTIPYGDCPRDFIMTSVTCNDIYNMGSWLKWHKKREWSWPKTEHSFKSSLASLSRRIVKILFNKIVDKRIIKLILY